MGKNKAQRTKNNAKPSNSSRSAELLGTSMPTFVGFSAVKDGGYVPVLPGLSFSSLNDVEVKHIDLDFQLALQKMNKKDATTKIKALQQFAILCRDGALSSVEAVLPFWPRLYCVLSLEHVHRVREAAQLAHGALVKRVGKNIAVYLKQLAGPWFTSQFDPYPPAASAATNSFQATFPQRKIVDAIVHCQQEILSHISNAITVQTPQSMSTHKTLTDDELEAKYQCALVMSLQAYSSYLKKVPVEQINQTEKFHRAIITSGRFWKIPKHDSVLVKTAFFNALASLIENATELIKEEQKRAMTAIITSLNETEPSLLTSVWESMLVAMTKIDDWHQSVNIEKLVLPKLWEVLKSGGQCCASIVYPNLLPFVSQFPKFNLEPKTLFNNFFGHMRQGFTAKSVQCSPSETSVVAKSFIECLRYAILLQKNDQDLCEELLRDQLIPVIESRIRDAFPLRKILFSEVTQLVRYWSKNRKNSVEYPAYAGLVAKFWTELELMFKNLIEKIENSYDDSSAIHDAQIELLCTLKSASTPSRKNLRVKFSSPDDPVEQKSDVKTVDIDDDATFVAEVDRFVNNLCVACLRKNNYQISKETMKFLSCFISKFESEELFLEIVQGYQDDIDLLGFYDQVLKKWLTEENVDIESTVELIFSALKYMNDTQKRAVLESLNEVQDSAIFKNIVACALSGTRGNDALIRNWCHGSRITDQLSDLATKLGANETSETTDDDEAILVLAFETNKDGELCVSQEAISRISMIFCGYLTQENSARSPKVIELMCQLVERCWLHKPLNDGSIKMLKSLFELSLSDPLNTSDAPHKDLVIETWKDGFAGCNELLQPDDLDKLHHDCINVIHEQVYRSHDSQTEDALVNIMIDFIEATIDRRENCVNSDPERSSIRSAIRFNTRDKTLIDEWIPQSLGMVLYGEILCGNFYAANPLRSIPSTIGENVIALKPEKLPDQMENCLKWATFTTKLVNKLIGKLIETESEGQLDSEVYEAFEELPYILNYILLIASIAHVYGYHYKSAKNYGKIESTLNVLLEECDKLRKYGWSSVRDRILTETLSVDDSWIEYGSLFSQFLSLVHRSDEHLHELHELGPKFLTEFVRENNETDLARDVTAVVVARCLLGRKIDSPECIGVLETFLKRHQSKPGFLLFDTDVSALEWSELVLPLEIIRLFSAFVKTAPEKLHRGLWDAALIFLSSWQLSVTKSKNNHEDLKVRALTVAVNELYYELQTLLSKRDPVAEIPSTLVDEWTNVFADDVQLGIADTWMFYTEQYNEKNDYLMPIIPLNYLGNSMSVIDGNIFFKNQESSLKIRSEKIVELALKLLESPVLSIQLSAYHLLSRVIPKLVEEDKLLLEGENCDTLKLNIRKFEGVLSSTQKIVNTMLMRFKRCDTTSFTIQPHTDSYTYAIGYLLSWANVLDMCAHAHADVRYQYADFLKDDYFPFLMNNIFRLMPVEALQDDNSKYSKLPELFTGPPSLDFRESWTEWRLDHIVCWLFINSLRHLPVLVRQWWGAADSRISAAVEKITMLHVSRWLCQEELNKKPEDIENMKISVHPWAREVVALYRMDDTKLELSMVLPVNHPLGSITVEPGRHAGGAANWRNCHMQLSIFLTHQNGSIWDGLLMWKRNLDKKFAGVEECFICYSIFHINTYQIPKLSCHKCRKKFHAPCLYKWFTTSQKSTCPICRNIF